MIDIDGKALLTIKKILNDFVPNIEVWAFGSRIKGTARSYSDLDLALVGHEKLDLPIIFRLQDAFEFSDLPFRVDVHDWHQLDANFQELIKKRYEILQ